MAELSCKMPFCVDCFWMVLYLGAVHWWWKRVRGMLLAAPRGVPARRCCATAGRRVELSAGVWMHVLVLNYCINIEIIRSNLENWRLNALLYSICRAHKWKLCRLWTGPPFIVSWNFMNEICVVRLNHLTEGEVGGKKRGQMFSS